MENFKIGQAVGFKADTEEYGELVAIQGNELTVKVWNDETCEDELKYTDKRRAWIEG